MLENNISRNNKIPGSSGCDSYTRPEEIKALSKFLGEQRKTLDGSIGLDETLLGVPGETTGRIPEVVLSSKIDSLDLSRVDDIIKLNEKLVTLDNNSSPIGANITSLPQGFIGIENSDNIDLSDKIETLQSEQEIDLEDKVQILDAEDEIKLDTTKKELSGDTNLTGLEDTKVGLDLSDNVTKLSNKIEGLETTDVKNLEDHIEQLKDNSNISLSDEIKLLNDSESTELSNKVNVLDDNTDINKLSETKVELVSDNKTELIKDLKKLEVTDNIDLGDSKISLETGDVENNLEEKRVDLINTSNIQGLSESIITLENKEHADSLSSVRKDLESQQSISELSNELVGIEDLTDITLRTDSVDLKDDGKIELGNTKVEFKDETKLELSSPLITIDPINFPDLSDFKDIINDDTVLELGDKKIDLTTTDNVELGSSIITVEDSNNIELSDKSIKVEDDNNIELGNSLITVEDDTELELSKLLSSLDSISLSELSQELIELDVNEEVTLNDSNVRLVDNNSISLATDKIDLVDSVNIELGNEKIDLTTTDNVELGNSLVTVEDNNNIELGNRLENLVDSGEFSLEDFLDTIEDDNIESLAGDKKLLGSAISPKTDNDYIGKVESLEIKKVINSKDYIKLGNSSEQGITVSERDKILDDAYITKTEALSGGLPEEYYLLKSKAPENDSDYNYQGEYQLLYDKKSLQSTQERPDHIKYNKFGPGGEIIESVVGSITSEKRGEILDDAYITKTEALSGGLPEEYYLSKAKAPENDSDYEYFDPSISGSKLYSGKPEYIKDPTKTVVVGKENLQEGVKYSGDLMILELHDKSYMTKNDEVKYTIEDQDHIKYNKFGAGGKIIESVVGSITSKERDEILDDAYITKTEALDGYIQDSYYIPDSEAPENDSDYSYRDGYQPRRYDKESLQSTQDRPDHVKLNNINQSITESDRDKILDDAALNKSSRKVEYSKENETPRPENDALYLPNYDHKDKDKELILTGKAQEIFDKIMNFSFSKDGKVTRDSLKVGENKAYIDGGTTTVSNWLQKIQALVSTYLNPGPYQSDWDTEKEEGKDLNGDGFIGKGLLKTKEDLKKELPRLEQFETKINQAIETAIFATKLETPRYKLPESSIGFEVSNYLRWIAEETVGLTKLSGNKKEILLRETLALIVWARDEAVKLAKADKSRLPGNTGLISDIVSGGLNVGNVVSSVSKAVSNAIFPDQTNPINRPELDDTGRISTSAWTNNSRVPSVSSSGDSTQEKKSIWKTLKDVTIGGSTPGNYSFAENYLNGIGIETTLLDLVGKNVSMIKNGTVEEFFDLLKSSPYITTVGKAGSSDGGYKVSTLDSNAYWEVILEPYAGVLNGEYTFLPLFGEINEINKKLHGVTTSYSRWIPVNSFELQKEKMTTRTLGLFDGEITYPTSVEFTNEFRLTIVDDQYKSWRTYFEKCLMAAVYSCKPNKLRDTKGKRKVFYVNGKRFFNEAEANAEAHAIAIRDQLSTLPEVTMKEEDFDTIKMLEDELIFDGEIRKLDKSFQLVAPYKNLSFRCRILVMTPQMSTITKYDLLLVLKDFAEERSGEIDSAGSDLTLSFSIVGENPPDRIATSSILAITDTGVGNMNKLREQEAAERKKDALKSVASGLLKSGPSMAIGLLS